MTGYGKAEALLSSGKLTLEIRTLNGKNAEINIKSSLLPKGKDLEVRKRLADKSLGLELTDAARQFVIDRGYDPVFGARPLKRFLQGRVETLIAKKLLSDELDAGNTLVIDLENGELVCRGK